MKMLSFTTLAFRSTLCLTLLFSLTAIGQESAQVGNEMDLLRNGDIRQQLGLSELQEQKLTEAQGANGREVMDSFLQRMKAEDDEAKRNKIREEMFQAVAEAKKAAGEQALTTLDSRQLKLLRSIYIQRNGLRALADSRVATEMALTDEQKKTIETLATERREASSKMKFDSTDEERDAFQQEWDAKYVAVLTDAQKKAWAEQSGGVPSVAGAGAGATPGINPGAGQNAEMSETGDAPPGAEVISSFGGVSDLADEGQLVEKFSFNFRYAPWDQILQDYAAGAGYTLDMNKTPPGTLSHIDNKEYNAKQAMDILNGYLQRRGYALVLKDGFLVCVNVDKGIPPNLIPDVSTDDLLKVENGIHLIGDNEIVRIEVPLEKLDVGVMAQEVEQLLGTLGTMTAFTQTGSLIIADTGSNLRRIKSYVDMSVARRKGDQVFKIYPLVNIDVEEAEFMLLSQFGMRQGVANVSAGSGSDRRGQPPVPTPSVAPTTLQVLSDTRTNSLLVTASPEQQTLVEEIVKAIDISEGPGGEKLTRNGNSRPYLRVYKVSGRADQVALSLNSMMPGVVVNEDGQAGTVHIFATAKQQEQVEEWVRAFSEGTGAGGSVAVIPLAKMDPLTAAATLRNLFISEGNAAPTIETDLYGNRIIVKGTAIQVDQIKQVLLDLGEDGLGLRKKGEGGTIRRYSLRGRDPAEFFEYLEQEWQATEGTSIRIVVPRKSGPIKGLRAPASGKDLQGDDGLLDESNPPTTSIPSHKSGVRKQSGYLPVSRLTDESRESQNPSGSSLPQAEKASDAIQIVVDGDELLLLSRDEDKLDRLEEMMDFLQESIPFRTKWTVFYLQAADATEAAALLEQFIPSSSVTNTASSSSFSMSSMFSPITQSVSDLTGLSGLGPNPQTLRMIPDTRSNSLFVTGPQSLVDEAEGFLEIIDSNNIPESLRDMQPRRIEVQYADIEDISKIVNETFKPFLEPPNRGQQQNPFAQMLGGAGGGNEPQGVQMTISTDLQTSTLIVSSSESLFTKVQSLITDLDETAKKANRTFRVVQLKHSDASQVETSLKSLFPRVTSGSTRTTSSSTGGGSGNVGTPPPATDPFQQMMQDRMRQQGGAAGGQPTPFGGGGASPFGGGGQFGGRGGFPGGGASGRRGGR